MSNKTYLNSMIILTVIVFLVALFGTTNHFMAYYDPSGSSTKKPVTPTPDPDPKPDPDPNPPVSDGREINGYKCKYDNCQILNGTSVINDKYVFIVDGTDNVVLFDVVKVEPYETYKSVKVTGNSFLIQNQEDKYGAIYVHDEVKSLIPFEYTNIEYVEDKDQFILTKNKSSVVADNKGNPVTLTYNAQIVDYNTLYIVTKTESDEYHIFNYNNRTELTEYVNSKRLYIELVGNYVGVLTDGYEYRLYDFQQGNKLITSYQLDNTVTSVRGVINRINQLEIYADSKLVKTLDIQ